MPEAAAGAAGAALLAICLLARTVAAADYCPQNLDPYMDEPSPFGWPMAPNEWSFAHTECWEAKYETCGGHRQSPMDIDPTSAACGSHTAGPAGALAERAHYKVVEAPIVSIAKYMRAASVTGDFGTITMKDSDGKDWVFEATSLLLTAPGLHTINGSPADAELLVVHRPKGVRDPFAGSVVVSVLFRAGENSSDLFSALGFGDDAMPPRYMELPKWKALGNIELPATMESALRGASYSYSGSAPVPPCAENIHYVVLAEEQYASVAQVNLLRSMLLRHTGGDQKRPSLPRQGAGGTCRPLLTNSLEVLETELVPQCEKNSERSAVCWAKRCDQSPVDIPEDEADDSHRPTNVSELLAYRQVSHITVVPAMYTVDVFADFGHVVLNGRLFDVKKISVKPMSQHTFNGVRYAGEVVIEHSLFGDDFPVVEIPGGRSGAPPSTSEADEGHHGHGRRMEYDEDGLPRTSGRRRPTSKKPPVVVPSTTTPAATHGPTAEGAGTTSEGPHRVMLSVPLKIGRESPLLRSFGLGQPMHKVAIRDGNQYEFSTRVDLSAALQPILNKTWYWYTGGPTTPENCLEHGVKWMVFEEPLEVSLDQLNNLALPVSGLDSTLPPRPIDPTKIAKDYLPEDGVESGNCTHPYLHPLCWKSEHKTCGSGKAQSPIDIRSALVSRVANDSFLERTSWKPIYGFKLENDGYDLDFKSDQMGYVRVIGSNGFPKYYQATSVMLHMPSEHFIDGKQFAAELQVVHKVQRDVLEVEDQDVLITSVLFDLGEESKLLKVLLPEHLPKPGESVFIPDTVDLMWGLGPALEKPFYHYHGSYAEPTLDCAEVVQWVVFGAPLTMSIEQWAHFKSIFPNPANNRPVQPLNGRHITRGILEEGKLAEYRFFLSRDKGLNPEVTEPLLILFPIMATLMICFVVVGATFIREAKHTVAAASGGVVLLDKDSSSM